MATIKDEEWQDYKTRFNKSYMDANDEAKRRNLVALCKKQIDEHNVKYEAGKETYLMRLNGFSDKTTEENSRMCGCRPAFDMINPNYEEN
ncbi:protein CTLA-2-beta-like [Haematobia irritans]|uniref:protein CTLA-2-beta-like n=1 Tax=Haematobia irritans TaxID=7368 RepID=UPI003F507C93